MKWFFKKMTKKSFLFSCLLFFLSTNLGSAWINGPSGNSITNDSSECDDPPYGTHDWIADHALDLLPNEEKAWIIPYKSIYLLGTEAPDNNDIPNECGAPNSGYDDRSLGHSVEWKADYSGSFYDADNGADLRCRAADLPEVWLRGSRGTQRVFTLSRRSSRSGIPEGSGRRSGRSKG